VLAWRLTHDAGLAALAARLGALLPAASGALDRDPIALLLAALAVLSALVYAALAAFDVRPRWRALTITVAALLLVVLPSLAFVAMGAATGRPYGQDGGVVQLPLAIDRILAGQSPYAADYSGTMLARQARVSSFWDEWGGNPILHHHAYLPGTHAVMLPFQLLSRASLGFFDPRLVTLVFYVLATVLAGRVPADAAGRLAAAGVAALNPLVYWHQIFGANDVVFVAMLLGAVLLARQGRAVAAGALIGLACATKQLAWPFAPFLLLGLSGARSWRELSAPSTWRRLAGPLAMATAVFALVVLPVAALDFRAFWSDIVGYNVGLPGADNYPLGGTPGFGFANFLIYFGRVAGLKDYFPFSVFYLLLLPLGLLLVRAQLRSERLEWAFATGSAALLASLYFSRVVHPNYLIPAAMLLPVAVLACRRAADVALAPLLLLAVAVEVAESALFRTAWEQASAAGLPARLAGLVAAFAPRAGAPLTRDPLGLLFSALAAGLGILYLACGVLGLPERARGWLLAASALLVVGAPTLVLVGVGERTGLVRAQDPGVVQARADAARLASGRSPYTPPADTAPPGREAVSSSFRLDPPAEHQPLHPTMPPGASEAALAGRLLGHDDLRVVALLAGVVALVAVAWPLPSPARTVVLASTLLAPPLALGLPLGSPVALPLAALLGTWACARRGRAVLAGVLAGVAAALDHRAALVAAPLLWMTDRPAAADGRSRLRSIAAAIVTYLVLVVPVLALDPSAFLTRLTAWSAPGAGLGIFNLLAYRGLEASPVALSLAMLAPAIAVLVMLLLLRSAVVAVVAAALVALSALVLAPAISAEWVTVPLALLALAGVREC
jgi:hypothetical protein